MSIRKGGHGRSKRFTKKNKTTKSSRSMQIKQFDTDTVLQQAFDNYKDYMKEFGDGNELDGLLSMNDMSMEDLVDSYYRELIYLKDPLQKYLDEGWDELSEEEQRSLANDVMEIAVDNQFYNAHSIVSDFVDNVKDNKGYLYRAIALDDITDLKPELGIYWSDDESYAEAHWADGATVYVIKAKLDEPEHIDIDTTIRARMSLTLGDEEQEITIYEGSPLEVVSITEKYSGNVIDYNINNASASIEKK